MKLLKRTGILILALIVALLAGCGGNAVKPSDPDATEDPYKGYSEWRSARSAGAEAQETSKVIEDYTLMEGTAESFKVAYYFANNMIVPRDRRIEIWGTADEDQNGKVVAAEFKGLKGSGVIENGEFCFALQGTLPASKEKGNSLIVRGAAGTEKEFTDVLVGDIWIVSGQSNADLTFSGTVPKSTLDIKNLYGDYLKNATAEDDIRIMQQINWNLLGTKDGVKRMATPQTDVGKTTKWQIAERKRVNASGTAAFSMLGYFFAKELYKLNPEVPIGMVMGACGGAPLSLLASPTALEKFPKSLRYKSLTLNGTNIPAGGIYNAFMAPLEHVGIAGVIFYQGESDCMESKDYCDALKAMVEDYRVRFGSDLLFLNVQLTSYGYESGGVNLDGVWNYVPDMRFAEAEVKIDGSIRGYEVIPSIDVGWKEGDADGAHPYYKLELGQRGAQMAAAILYGIGNMEDAGFPIPARVLHNNDEIIVLYDYAGGGLKTLNGADVQGFEVKLNGAWQPAQAVIDGNKITVAASGAEGIRYASSLRYTSTDTANLCSGTGNIAVPFSVEFN
ncbi:MAG: hypothetical protein IJM24_05575 [Clostridia bacterium]|nr:hypothetical protein [Clostridia bacterium]